MRTFAAWARLLGVAAGYAIAFVALQRAMPFSLASPWFVVVAMICVLGLAFVAQPLVMIRMPRPLRTIRAWEVEGGVYRRLRVPAFGSLLRRTPLRFFNTDVYLRDGLRGTQRVAAELEAAEASHFWAAALVVPYMVHLTLGGLWVPLFWVSLAQLFINVYPVLHLRLTRHRLSRLQARRAVSATRRGDRPARDPESESKILPSMEHRE
jgi:Glycosyl-4,4'-diaponeurosporenoate acyltransferase